MRVEPVDPSRTLALRRAVMRPGTPLDEPFGYDCTPGALHLAAVEASEHGGQTAVIGACMLAPEPFAEMPEATPAWRLRGMATAPGRRGTGIGTAVIGGVLSELVARDARLLWCNARIEAVDFYLRCGFQVIGPVFVPDDLPIPHRRMWRTVEPAAPATSSGRVERSDDRSRGA